MFLGKWELNAQPDSEVEELLYLKGKRKLLKTDKYIKQRGKIHIWYTKSAAFLQTKEKHAEEEIKRKCHSQLLLNKMKKKNQQKPIDTTTTTNLGIKVTKEVKGIYNETLTLTKEIKDTRWWKDLLCSWIGRINIEKMTILPKAICRFYAISIKLQYHPSQKNIS